MKRLLLFIPVGMLMSFTTWQPSLDAAKQLAKEKQEHILLNFSGSDWCGPCIRMHKEILENDAFSRMADTTVVMLNADFPRSKKNMPDAAKQKQNNALADKYNPNGIFPYTVLLNADGKVIHAWQGLPKEDATQFAAEVKQLCDADKQ